MVELGSDPDAKFGASRQDSKSFADVSDRPALEVEFIDGVNSFSGESRFEVFTVGEGISGFDDACVLVGVIVFIVEPTLTSDLRFLQKLGSHTVAMLIMDFVFFVFDGFSSLSVIDFFLQLFTVFSHSHFLFVDWQTVDDRLNALLFFVVRGQLVDKFVDIFGDFAVLNIFGFA